MRANQRLAVDPVPEISSPEHRRSKTDTKEQNRLRDGRISVARWSIAESVDVSVMRPRFTKPGRLTYEKQITPRCRFGNVQGLQT
jgi:hypothetical protein